MVVYGIHKHVTFYIKDRLHSPFEKSLIERVIQYFKNRTESFDDYYPCTKNSSIKCDLQHVYNWMKLFVYLYNAKVRNLIVFKIGGEIPLT